MLVELPVSGLHRLFHKTPSFASSQSTKTQSSLESVTEEAHTYDLLYPEPSSLRQPQSHVFPFRYGDPSSVAHAATSHDDRGGLELQSLRDIRILIAQSSPVQHRLLYDSHLSSFALAQQSTKADAAKLDERYESSPSSGLTGYSTNTTPPRGGSKSRHIHGSSSGFITQSQFTSSALSSSFEPESNSAFGYSRLLRSSTRPTSSGGESTQSSISWHKREEAKALLECMFGATGIPSASSTKLHIKPASIPNHKCSAENTPIIADQGFYKPIPRRLTTLTRSTTADDFHSFSPVTPEDLDMSFSNSRNPALLITRLFSIDLTDSELLQGSPIDSDYTPMPKHQPEGFRTRRRPSGLTEDEKTEQPRIPVYAVSILLQLPFASQHFSSISTHGTMDVSNSHDKKSSQHSMETGPAYWRDTSQLEEGLNNRESDIDFVVARWSTLNRVISHLEGVAKKRIKDLLIKLTANMETSLPQSPIVGIDNTRKLKMKSDRSSFGRTIQLPSEALQQCETIQKEASAAGTRIVLALRTRRVISGQGRWGIWREEARWMAKWAGSKEQNFFFFNLLTAFLGTHMDWLDLSGKRWPKYSRTKPSHHSRKDLNIVQRRTVIVSSDKMAARRLIFLLSAFLPGTLADSANEDACQSQMLWANASRPQSPPPSGLILRQQSLRRNLNRRQRGSQYNSSNKIHDRGVSISSQDFVISHSSDTADHSSQHHSRRSSDARSIRSLPLPISTTSDSARKASTMATATVVPNAALPVPHFSSSLSPSTLLGTSTEARPGSGGSIASLSLKHTLARSEYADRSNGSLSSQPTSRWGSMISGFWGSRRGSSTDGSDGLVSSQEGLGISGLQRERRSSRSIGRLEQTIEEADKQQDSSFLSGEEETNKLFQSVPDPTSAPLFQESLTDSFGERTAARNIPARPGTLQFPVKLSVDEQDGVIDINLPMASSFPSSIASSMSSHKASHTGASSFHDTSHLGCPSFSDNAGVESGSTIDVAGWLKHYHQDFALQAVRPYKELEEDVKQSLHAEPVEIDSLLASHWQEESAIGRWTEVCTALIANAQNFSIVRLCLKRRVVQASRNPHEAFSSPVPIVEEEITTEPIMDLDSTLIDAVERVLAQSTHSSRAHSRATSPSRHLDEHRAFDGSLEVPKSECKKLLLGALEQVVRSVSDEASNLRRRNDKSFGKGSTLAKEDEIPDSTLREGIRKWLGRERDGI